MKYVSSIILGLALLSSLRAADAPAPATPAAAPAPAQLELAHKVIKATQFDRIFDQLGAQMQQMAAQSMGFAGGPQSTAEKEAATKVLGEVTKLSIDAAKSMLEKVDGVYAEVYSEAELKAMLAFFESPEGKSMILKQPQIMQHMMPLVKSMQAELMPKIQGIVEKAKTEAAAAVAPAAPTQLPPQNPALTVSPK